MKAYALIDNQLTRTGEMDVLFFSNQKEAEKKMDGIWDHLTPREQKKVNELAVFEMELPEGITLQDLEDDITGEIDWIEFLQRPVAHYVLEE